METIGSKSPETTAFLESLDELREAVRRTMTNRSPHLNGEKFLTVKSLTEMLHISARTQQDYRDRGEIGYIQITGKILYKESDILKWLEENYRSANPWLHAGI